MHRGMGALFWLGGADAHMLDTEGWWSVTPEILATHQSSLCKRYSRGHVALDAMAGVSASQPLANVLGRFAISNDRLDIHRGQLTHVHIT
eukprot:1158464-Pelagomonas_calceolata.AAC.2